MRCIICKELLNINKIKTKNTIDKEQKDKEKWTKNIDQNITKKKPNGQHKIETSNPLVISDMQIKL